MNSPDPVPLVTRAAGDTARLLAQLTAAFAASASSRLPKHVRLHEALVREIDAGRVAPGTRLPGERELCAVGVSLGTAQKALGLLATQGRIIREHGRGTFVRAGRGPLSDLWHFRFREPGSAALLPVFATVLERDRAGADAAPGAGLPSASGYVRIRRLVDIGGRFRCWSEMLLPLERFGGLLTRPKQDLEGINLKQLLAHDFNAPTLATRQTVLTAGIPPAVADLIGAAPQAPGLLLQILGTSHGGEPITFQRIRVPPTACELELGGESPGAATAAAAA